MAKRESEDEGTLISREETIKRLAISYNELRRRESRGELKQVSRKTTQGRAVMYRLIDVESLRERRLRDRSDYTPEEASVVFGALEKGMTPAQIVVQLKVEPKAVEVLALTYSHMTGGIFIPADVLRSLNSLDIDGPVPMKTHQDVQEVIESLVKAACMECEKRPRQLCKFCVQAAIKQVRAEADGTADL